MAGEKVKISQMTTAAIADNDVVPFVKVPLSGNKMNGKFSIAELKAYLLNTQSYKLNFVDVTNDEDPFDSIILQASALITSDNNKISSPDYTTQIVNNSPTPIVASINFPVKINSVLDALAFDPTPGIEQNVSVEYNVEITANGALLGIITRSVEFWKYGDDSAKKLIDRKTEAITAIIDVEEQGAVDLVLKCSISRFITSAGYTLPSNALTVAFYNITSQIAANVMTQNKS